MLLMKRGLRQHLFMLQASLRQRIKDKLPKQKQVQMNATKEIIGYQIKLLNEEQNFLKNIIDKLPTFYGLYLIIGDMIFEDHSYEEEDNISNLENPCIGMMGAFLHKCFRNNNNNNDKCRLHMTYKINLQILS
ncbi:unnamed protein product [Paramecium sonneborni]|uniref:Uncharacterized protein n=1 Tax=Paramecium sonneborni TaxID=65129 RepID=A0A8S1LF67_9CILI|nr:unnamed protein product [Paramecium sonneborni]